MLKDDRLTLPVEPAYASALGLAVFAFAELEWIAVTCCDKLAPGSVEALSERTAGRVADTLRGLVNDLADTAARQEMEDAAADFQAFTRTRNNLLHARPGTDAAGLARLFRDGDQWTISEMEAVADAFTGCGARLSRLFGRPEPAA